LRAAGVVVIVALALYVWRAATVRVVVANDGVTVRNLTGTHRYHWTEIERITSIPTASTLLGGMAGYVTLELRDDSEVRARALRRKPADARAIAEDLDHLRRSLS
jgi:Bacterial PH domain